MSRLLSSRMAFGEPRMRPPLYNGARLQALYASQLSQNRSYYFEAAKTLLPHPQKTIKGGEDAAMCGSRCLGVADGVGGWESVGVDSGLYSREILERVSQAFEDHEAKSRFTPAPVDILKKAYHRTQAIGSSTVCLVFMDDFAKEIKAANLGDSGYIVFRPSTGEVIARSEAQCHDFNFPVQLGTGSSDQPEHAETAHIPVQPGDVVLLATDGVWDNLFEEEIVRVLQRTSDPQESSQEVAKLASAHSNDQRRLSPFSQRERLLTEASQVMGGKPDDIAVVIGVVRDPDEMADDTVPTQISERRRNNTPPHVPS